MANGFPAPFYYVESGLQETSIGGWAGGMKTGSLILLMAGILLAADACHKAPSTPTPPIPAKTQPLAVPTPPPVTVPETWVDLPLPPSRLSAPPEPLLPKNFRDGEASFQAGKYAESINFYEKYIQEDAVTQYRDVALFKLGLCYTLTCSTAECRAKSMEKSQEQFRRLVSQFPKSPYAAEARSVLALQNDIGQLRADVKTQDEKIKKLTDELDRLKKIDLERKTTRIKK